MSNSGTSTVLIHSMYFRSWCEGYNIFSYSLPGIRSCSQRGAIEHVPRPMSHSDAWSSRTQHAASKRQEQSQVLS